MGELRYCFEQKHIPSVLRNIKPQGLAVIDSDGISKAVIQSAVSRGVLVYDYINCGALENGRSYYDKYKHLRLARYEGWSILDSIGGRVTHRSVKTDDGVVIVEVTE